MNYLSDIHWWLFPLGIGLDMIWVMWMNAVEKNWPVRSGFWGMMTAAVSLFATIDVIHEPVQCIPYLGGIFFGSVLGVYLKRKQKHDNSH